jgi:hypothetical protein
LKIVQETSDGMKEKSEKLYNCSYCGKRYTRERTLISHLCEPKRRAQQERETGVQLGLQSYIRFYSRSQRESQIKTYEEFSQSPYYNAFVKFGRYCQDIRCVNFSSYLNWLLDSNQKLDRWTSDKLYETWLREYIRKEAVQDALERALKEMQSYADDLSDGRSQFCDYFRIGNTNRICFHISTGRVSPWAVFNCESGREFLRALSEEQIGILMPWIDPEFWQRRFRDLETDTKWAQSILETAGL